nr:MAG TPA: hypothetical protein [Caudoviricetes sp.]
MLNFYVQMYDIILTQQNIYKTNVWYFSFINIVNIV